MVALAGKVVLVTGSGKGIGRYIAHTFAEAGAKVCVNDIESPQAVARELAEKGAESLAIQADVREEVQVRAMIDRVISRFGRIDVLVNNAAVVTHFQWGLPHWPRMKEMDKAFWDKVWDTNLDGTFLCTKYALAHMEAQRSGHIVNTMGGSSPESIGSCAYAVSKIAIRAMTEFLAHEERDFNIVAVLMRPGAQIATEEAPEEARARMAGPDFIGNRYVLAAEAPMELSGNLLEVQDGKLVVSAR